MCSRPNVGLPSTASIAPAKAASDFSSTKRAPRVCRPQNSAARSNRCGLRAMYKPSRGARRVLQTSQKWPEIAGSKWRGFAKPGERFHLLSPNAVVLLFFNLGVEIGQLAFVAAVLTAGGLFRTALALRLKPALIQRAVNQLDVIAAYAIGTVAAFWLIERTSAF